MLRHPAVFITAIMCGTVLGLGLLGVVGWLLYSGKDTAAILTLVNALVSAGIYAKLRDVDGKTTRVEQSVNGNTTRLMDAALKDKTPDV